MVIAYHVGKCHKKNGHLVREVDYIKMDENHGHHYARCDKHRKVKTTVWGGLDKDRQPKAATETKAINMIRAKRQIKYNEKQRKKEINRQTQDMILDYKKRHYSGTTKANAERSMMRAALAKKDSRTRLTKDQVRSVELQKNRPNARRRRAARARAARANN